MRTRQRIGLGLVVGLVGLGLSSEARAQPSEKWVLQLAVPYINSFYLQPTGEPDAKVNTGFWGFGAGLLFRHTPTQYVGLSASVAIDISVPFPAAVDYLGEQEFMTAYAMDWTNNHVFGRIRLGYGVSYVANRWELEYFDDPESPPPTRDPVERRSDTLGLVFPAYYPLDDRFAVGLVYRPSLYRFGAEAGFRYEHVVSVVIAWNLGLF